MRTTCARSPRSTDQRIHSQTTASDSSVTGKPVSAWRRQSSVMPSLAARSATMAMAVVGGINEMVLQSIEQGRAAKLQELVEPASALLRAAISAEF